MPRYIVIEEYSDVVITIVTATSHLKALAAAEEEGSLHAGDYDSVTVVAMNKDNTKVYKSKTKWVLDGTGEDD